MTESANILVVEDDPKIQTLVSEYLEAEGFTVQSASSAQEAFRHLRSFTPDVVVLDLGLPDEHGMSVAAKLRERDENFGIIMLTGRTEVVDRVLGLEAGADDYITKPFNLRELLARIRSNLRRINQSAAGSQSQGVYRFNSWVLNVDTRELTTTDGEVVAITSKEFDLLKLLVTHAGKTVTRANIAQHLGAADWNPLSRGIDVLVYQLRSKLEQDSAKPTLIKTVRGAGYIFTGQFDEVDDDSVDV